MVEIDVTTLDKVDEIVLNSKELEIDTVEINSSTAKFNQNPVSESLTLVCPSLAPGQHLVRIEYRGVHNDKRMGFYRTKFEVILFGFNYSRNT